MEFDGSPASKYNFYGLSLLFVLSADKKTAEVFIIDFDKARLKRDDFETDIGTIDGLKSLEVYFKEPTKWIGGMGKMTVEDAYKEVDNKYHNGITTILPPPAA